MYSYFINTAILILRGDVHANFPEKLVNASIKRCQDLQLFTVLGKDLYIYIEANLLTLPANYSTLLNDYIVDFLANAVMADLVVHGSYEMYNKGLTKKRDDFSDPIDLLDTEKISDRFKMAAEGYRLRLIQYLVDNRNLYPEYKYNNNTYQSPVYLRDETNNCR